MGARRLSLQLTPLLDLLLIVIFAQYLEMEQKTQAVTSQRDDRAVALEYQLRETQQKLNETTQVLELVQQHRFQAESDLASSETALEKQRAASSAEREELNQRLDDVSKQRDRIVSALRRAYAASSEEIKNLLEALAAAGVTPQPVSPQNVEELASEIEDSEPRDLATFLLAYEEIRKRCDIWDIHITPQELVQIQIGEEEYAVRPTSSEDFQQQLFNLYKSLPQAKGLVIMLVSYGEVPAATRQNVLTALPQVTDRMRADADGRTRFEYAVVGYLPENDNN